MKTLFDLFSSGNCIGCNKVLKTYYHCDCYENNNIVYSFSDLQNLYLYTTILKTILIRNVFYDANELVFLTYKNNKFYYKFSAFRADEYIFDFPEKEFESNEDFLLYFNDVVRKTYNNLIFI